MYIHFYVGNFCSTLMSKVTFKKVHRKPMKSLSLSLPFFLLGFIVKLTNYKSVEIDRYKTVVKDG